MPELKQLSKTAIPQALEKAERYRLLNEPSEAESICLDILNTDPGNQPALVTLLLAVTDRYSHGQTVIGTDAEQIVPRLRDPYERAYYEGIIAERKAKAALYGNSFQARFVAYDLLKRAMAHFQQAEALRPAGNDDALLRWNTCVRIIERNKLLPRDDSIESPLE